MSDLRGPLPERHPADDDRVARRRVDQGHGDRRSRAGRAGRQGGRGAGRARALHRAGRSATATSAWASPTSTRASAAPSRGPCTPPSPGRTYPELIVRMARGEPVEPHVGEFRAGLTFTRYYWQLELDEEQQAHGPRHRRSARPAGAAVIPTAAEGNELRARVHVGGAEGAERVERLVVELRGSSACWPQPRPPRRPGQVGPSRRGAACSPAACPRMGSENSVSSWLICRGAAVGLYQMITRPCSSEWTSFSVGGAPCPT